MVDRLLGKELCVLAWAVEGMGWKNPGSSATGWPFGRRSDGGYLA